MMQLPKSIVSQFAKLSKVDNKKMESTSYGTIVEKDDAKYVKLDGSDVLTPISTTVDMEDGERVTVLIKNHTAIVTGNISSPAARTGTVKVISEQVKRIGEIVYPVGSIYTSINPTDPSILFGGTWEQLKDCFLLAAGDNYEAGTTGGEAAHTLTVDEMPSHNHLLYVRGFDDSVSKEALVNGSYNYTSEQSHAGEAELIISSSGGSAAHNNMPPYLTVYIWKRIK